MRLCCACIAESWEDYLMNIFLVHMYLQYIIYSSVCPWDWERWNLVTIRTQQTSDSNHKPTDLFQAHISLENECNVYFMMFLNVGNSAGLPNCAQQEFAIVPFSTQFWTDFWYLTLRLLISKSTLPTLQVVHILVKFAKRPVRCTQPREICHYWNLHSHSAKQCGPQFAINHHLSHKLRFRCKSPLSRLEKF